MRYIIHLLPEDGQRRAYDAARARVAALIGRNRALDYPTAHLTLVWAIEDDPVDPGPIASAALLALLEARRGARAIPLTVGPAVDTREHLLLPIVDTPALAALRRGLYDDAVRVAGGTDGARVARAARVREQPWPHLTLAQELTPERRARGLAALLRDDAALLTAPLLGAELALLARDLAAGTPYRIIGRIPLDG